MSIKPVFIVTDMDGYTVRDADSGIFREFKTDKSALKVAATELKATAAEEVWVWRLSHVVSQPDVEPDVEVVK